MDEIRKIALECAARSLAGQPHCTEDVTLRADTFCEWLSQPSSDAFHTVDPKAAYGRKKVISRETINVFLSQMTELHRHLEMQSGRTMRDYGYAINDFYAMIEKYFDEKDKKTHETDGI